jgi:hypothetical protein
VALNALAGAQLGNVIDNTNFTQTWNWSTASTSDAFKLSANALTSGNVLTVDSSSSLFTGSLAKYTISGNATTTAGSALSVAITGTSSVSTGLLVSNLGTGLSIDVSSGGVAFRRGTDYSTTGITNDAPFSNASLIRLTGATAQTITGIANGADGKLLTLMNAGPATSTLRNHLSIRKRCESNVSVSANHFNEEAIESVTDPE